MALGLKQDKKRGELFLLLLLSMSRLLFLVLFSSSDVFVLLGILGGLRDCVWVFDNGFCHRGFWVYFNGYLLLILGIFFVFFGRAFCWGFGADSREEDKKNGKEMRERQREFPEGLRAF